MVLEDLLEAQSKLDIKRRKFGDKKSEEEVANQISDISHQLSKSISRFNKIVFRKIEHEMNKIVAQNPNIDTTTLAEQTCENLDCYKEDTFTTVPEIFFEISSLVLEDK